jgi:hypothetical protein
MAITLGGGLAGGDRIDAAALNAIEIALPPNTQKSYRNAVEISYAAARGERVDALLAEAGRREANRLGGPEAVAAYDAGIALGTGKGLQDAGFKLMEGWVKSNDTPIARALQFGLDVRSAAARGISVGEFLIEQAVKELNARVPALEQAELIYRAVQYFIAHPEEVVNPQTADLADRLGIPIEAIRAAIIVLRRMSDGTLVVMPDRLAQFHHPLIKEAASSAGPSAIQSAAYINPLIHEATLAAASVIQSQGVHMNVQSFGRLPDQTVNDKMAALGIAIAASDSRVGAARSLAPNAQWQRGFDVAVGATATNKSTVPGPGQTALRNTLYSVTDLSGRTNLGGGFDVGQALMHGINKELAGQPALGGGISQDPFFQMGQLAISGLVGSGSSPQTKAGVASTIIGSPSAKAGATSAIEEHKGVWAKILDFFGLGDD